MHRGFNLLSLSHVRRTNNARHTKLAVQTTEHGSLEREYGEGSTGTDTLHVSITGLTPDKIWE